MYEGAETRTNEVECLGRGVMFTAGGVEIHGGPKHAAMVLTELEMPMCKPVGGPHVVDAKSLDTLADETRDFMPPSEARRHRSAVVRVVYVAQDRPHLDVVACIVSETWSRPREGDEVLVKSVCRYIKGRPRYVQVYEYQEQVSWWCRRTATGRHAEGPTRAVGCILVATFIIIGVGSRLASRSAQEKPICTLKFVAFKRCSA